MKEILKEVYSSISRHKMRSLLTGFGIAWGIFILIVLLGAGNGFRSGILTIFSSYASNSIWVTGNWVSETSSKGMQIGSNIRFDDDLISKLKCRFPQIKQISSEYNYQSRELIKYMEIASSFQIRGIEEDYMSIKLLEISEGRNFNKLDYRNKRQVAIIGKQVKDILFKKEDPLGKFINISGGFFQVIGLLDEGTIFSMMEKNRIYIPHLSLFDTFNLHREFDSFGLIIYENVPVENFENDLRSFLSSEIGFNKEDKNALFINNIQLQVKSFNKLFDGIDIFLWILGICFLLSGMIGITNIMLVIVKERTVEIGIRKALGATPNSIMQLILIESLLITTLFGVIGLICGYGGLFFYNWFIEALQTGQQEVFSKGYINISVIIISFVILIVAGLLAGILPAKNAVSIMPIQTLNKIN